MPQKVEQRNAAKRDQRTRRIRAAIFQKRQHQERRAQRHKQEFQGGRIFADAQK